MSNSLHFLFYQYPPAGFVFQDHFQQYISQYGDAEEFAGADVGHGGARDRSGGSWARKSNSAPITTPLLSTGTGRPGEGSSAGAWARSPEKWPGPQHHVRQAEGTAHIGQEATDGKAGDPPPAAEGQQVRHSERRTWMGP